MELNLLLVSHLRSLLLKQRGNSAFTEENIRRYNLRHDGNHGNKGLNHACVNKAFGHNASRFCLRCLFICHISITTGLFVECGKRIEKKCVAVHYFFFGSLARSKKSVI